MAEIKSNGDIARGHANRLQAATNQLSGIGSITKDSETTMKGNTNAHNHADFLSSLAAKASSALTNASNNLHSAASEFEAADQAAASSIKGE